MCVVFGGAAVGHSKGAAVVGIREKKKSGLASSDPVMAADGHAHERSAIERWLATHQVDEPADGRRARAQHPGPEPHAAPDDPGLGGGTQGSVTRLGGRGVVHVF